MNHYLILYIIFFNLTLYMYIFSNKMCVKVIMLLCIAVVVGIQQPNSASTNTIRRLDDGLVIDKASELLFQNMVWRVIVTLDVPSLPVRISDRLRAIDTALQRLQSHFTSLEKLSWWTRLERTQYKLSDEYLHGNQHHVTIHRPKRGLFNFVGVLQHHLFGVATSKEIAQTRKLLSKVSKNNQAVNHFIGDLATVVNQSRSYIDQNRHRINQLSALSGKLLETIKRFAGGVQMLANKNMQRHQAERLLEDAEVIVDAYIEQVNIYHRQRTALEAGVLTEDLLPQALLQEILTKTRGSGYSPINPLEWYYQYVHVYPLWGEDNLLVFKAELPLVGPRTFQSYRLEAFPMPQKEGLVATLRVTPYVAMDRDTGNFIIPKDCRGLQPRVCGPAPQRRGDAMACEYGIFSLDNTARQQCVLKVEKTLQMDQVWLLSNNRLVLSTWGGPINIECIQGHTFQHELSSGVYVVNMTEHCKYSAPTWNFTYTPMNNIDIHIEGIPLPDIPPVDIPHFINSSGWNLHDLHHPDQLGDVKQFTLGTLTKMDWVDIPAYKPNWVVGLIICLIILLLIAIICLILWCKRKSIPILLNNQDPVCDQPSKTPDEVVKFSELLKKVEEGEPSIAQQEQDLRLHSLRL